MKLGTKGMAEFRKELARQSPASVAASQRADAMALARGPSPEIVASTQPARVEPKPRIAETGHLSQRNAASRQDSLNYEIVKKSMKDAGYGR